MPEPQVKTQKGMPELDGRKMYTVKSTGTASNLGPAGEPRVIDGNTAKVLISKGYIERNVTEYVAPKKSVKKTED
jgi:hypothetical protein